MAAFGAIRRGPRLVELAHVNLSYESAQALAAESRVELPSLEEIILLARKGRADLLGIASVVRTRRLRHSAHWIRDTRMPDPSDRQRIDYGNGALKGIGEDEYWNLAYRSKIQIDGASGPFFVSVANHPYSFIRVGKRSRKNELCKAAFVRYGPTGGDDAQGNVVSIDALRQMRRSREEGS